MSTIEDKISALLDGANGWTEHEFRALAMAALDQGGVSLKRQLTVAKLIDVCVDCRESSVVHNDRCEPCCERYDDDRREMARDMALDRRIDEARGK